MACSWGPPSRRAPSSPLRPRRLPRPHRLPLPRPPRTRRRPPTGCHRRARRPWPPSHGPRCRRRGLRRRRATHRRRAIRKGIRRRRATRPTPTRTLSLPLPVPLPHRSRVSAQTAQARDAVRPEQAHPRGLPPGDARRPEAHRRRRRHPRRRLVLLGRAGPAAEVERKALLLRRLGADRCPPDNQSRKLGAIRFLASDAVSGPRVVERFGVRGAKVDVLAALAAVTDARFRGGRQAAYHAHDHDSTASTGRRRRSRDRPGPHVRAMAGGGPGARPPPPAPRGRPVGPPFVEY